MMKKMKPSLATRRFLLNGRTPPIAVLLLLLLLALISIGCNTITGLATPPTTANATGYLFKVL